MQFAYPSLSLHCDEDLQCWSPTSSGYANTQSSLPAMTMACSQKLMPFLKEEQDEALNPHNLAYWSSSCSSSCESFDMDTETTPTSPLDLFNVLGDFNESSFSSVSEYEPSIAPACVMSGYQISQYDQYLVPVNVNINIMNDLDNDDLCPSERDYCDSTAHATNTYRRASLPLSSPPQNPQSRPRSASVSFPLTINTSNSNPNPNTDTNTNSNMREDKRRSGPSPKRQKMTPRMRKATCTHCGSQSSPAWRRDVDHNLVCNACGIYQRQRQQRRPSSLFHNVPMNITSSPNFKRM